MECWEGMNRAGSRIMRRENKQRRSGDDKTEGDGREGVEHLQPDGTVAIDNIIVPK